jgi:hypothetical protein
LLQSVLRLYDATFYPLGFSVRISTDSQSVIDAAHAEWNSWRQAFSAPPVTLQIVVNDSTADRPPASVFRADAYSFSVRSDGRNFAVGTPRAGHAVAYLTCGAVEDAAWLQYNFLDALAFQLITSTHLTPIHASCVARQDRATLLAGNSQAGKSSLAFACARRGWTYISDDACPLVRRCAAERLVVGAAHTLRLRPDAPNLFPELAAFETTMRGNGKHVLQIPTSSLAIETAASGHAARFILLNRQDGPACLSRVPNHVIQDHCAQHFYTWDPPIALAQRTAFATMLEGMDAFTLRYSSLDAAIDLLEQ